MHLVGPHMTTTNYKKRRTIKFKSAAQKARYMVEQKALAQLHIKYNVGKTVSFRPVKYSSDFSANHNPSAQIPSHSKYGIASGACVKPEPKVYTGNKLIGIATMHKSNMVPVFNHDDAKEIAKMRR